jgi:hypothetical protein
MVTSCIAPLKAVVTDQDCRQKLDSIELTGNRRRLLRATELSNPDFLRNVSRAFAEVHSGCPV